MMVVDSSVWIDYFNGTASAETERLDQLLGLEPVALGDLILTEVLQGIRSDKDFDRVRDMFSAFATMPMLGSNLAITSANNYRLLRKRGVTVRKTIDCIIATYCIEHSHSLLFSDRDFQPFVDELGLAPA